MLNKQKLEGVWQVSSAGTWAMAGIPPMAETIAFARKKGYNIDHVRSREVDAYLLQDADLVIAMTNGQKEALALEFPQEKGRIFLCSEVCENLAYTIPDPFDGHIDQTPEELGDELCRLIEQGFDSICELARALHQERMNLM